MADADPGITPEFKAGGEGGVVPTTLSVPFNRKQRLSQGTPSPPSEVTPLELNMHKYHPGILLKQIWTL